MAEPGGVGEAVTKAGMCMTKAKRSSSANTVGKTVAPAAGVDRAEPETGPIPVLGPVSVLGNVEVTRRHTAIIWIVVEAWIAGIRGGMRLRS